MTQKLNSIVALRLPHEHQQRLEALALAEDRTISYLARRLIIAGLENQEHAGALPAAPYIKSALQDQCQEVPC